MSLTYVHDVCDVVASCWLWALPGFSGPGRGRKLIFLLDPYKIRRNASICLSSTHRRSVVDDIGAFGLICSFRFVVIYILFYFVSVILKGFLMFDQNRSKITRKKHAKSSYFFTAR